MQLKLLRFILFISITFLPLPDTQGEAVLLKRQTTPSHIENRETAPPIKHKKRKFKKKRQRFKKGLPKQTKQNKKISPWTVVGSIIGFLFLWLGLIFLPFLIVFIILGVNPFVFLGLPIIFIIVGIMLLNSAINATSNAFNKEPNLLKRQQRTFGIINLIAGATSILISLAFTIVMIAFFIGTLSFTIFALPLIGLVLGIYLILNGIPLIDGSYGDYSTDSELQAARLKKRIKLGWIGFGVLLAIALVLFLLAAWLFGIIALAATIGILLTNLLLARK